MTRTAWRALLAAAALACGDPRERALSGLHGVKLTPVRAKPDFTFENTDGQPFHFAADTRGTVTLLSFNARPIESVKLDWIGEIYLAVRAGQVRRMQQGSARRGIEKRVRARG